MSNNSSLLIDNFHNLGRHCVPKRNPRFNVTFDRITLIGDYQRCSCTSTLVMNKGIYEGKISVKDPALKDPKFKGITFPEIKVCTMDGHNGVTLTMTVHDDENGKYSFSTTYRPALTKAQWEAKSPEELIREGEYDKKLNDNRAIMFPAFDVCWPLKSDNLGYIIQGTIRNRIDALSAEGVDKFLILSPSIIASLLANKLLTTGFYDATRPNSGRKYTLGYKLIKEINDDGYTPEAIQLMKTGIVIKRTRTWYNNTRKEESELIIVNPLGVGLVFDWKDKTLEAPKTICYVGLA